MKVLVGRQDKIYRLINEQNVCVGTILLYTDVLGRPRARLGPPRGVVWSKCDPVSKAEVDELLRLLPRRERDKIAEYFS